MTSSSASILEPVDNNADQPRQAESSSSRTGSTREASRLRRWLERLDRWGRVVFWPVGAVAALVALVAAATAYWAGQGGEWLGALLFLLVALGFGWLAWYSFSPRRRLSDLEP